MKTKSSKSRKTDIFPNGLTHSFGPKFAFFQTFFFLGNIGQENVFYKILERKNASLAYKNKKFKKWKNWHFSKGVNPWFWSKNGRFSSLYFLGNIEQKNLFYDILEEKTSFLTIKTTSSKSRKIDIFPKGKCQFFDFQFFPWFLCKNSPFSNFLFRQYGPGKCLLPDSRTKKCLSKLWKEKVQTAEKLRFFQRG